MQPWSVNVQIMNSRLHNYIPDISLWESAYGAEVKRGRETESRAESDREAFEQTGKEI